MNRFVTTGFLGPLRSGHYLGSTSEGDVMQGEQDETAGPIWQPIVLPRGAVFQGKVERQPRLIVWHGAILLGGMFTVQLVAYPLSDFFASPDKFMGAVSLLWFIVFLVLMVHYARSAQGMVRLADGVLRIQRRWRPEKSARVDARARARLYRWLAPRQYHDNGAVMLGTGGVIGPLLEVQAEEKTLRLGAMLPAVGQALPRREARGLNRTGLVYPHVEIPPDDFIRLCEQLGLRLPQ